MRQKQMGYNAPTVISESNKLSKVNDDVVYSSSKGYPSVIYHLCKASSQLTF